MRRVYLQHVIIGKEINKYGKNIIISNVITHRINIGQSVMRKRFFSFISDSVSTEATLILECSLNKKHINNTSPSLATVQKHHRL